MSDRGVRSVLLLCWRDTGHPQGGGSETYLQRIGAQLAASGVEVTLRTARYPGSARREIVDGVKSEPRRWLLLHLHLGGSGDGARPHRTRPAAQRPARRGDRLPERHPVPGAAGVRTPRRRARAPLPSRAVAGRRSGDGSLRLVRGVPAVAVAAPPQSVRHGVAAVGAGPDFPWRGSRPDRHRAQRPRPGSRGHPDHTAVGNAEGGGAVASGAAQADRGRTRGDRRTACPRCRACTWTSWVAAGGNGAWSSTPSYSASPTR